MGYRPGKGCVAWGRVVVKTLSFCAFALFYSLVLETNAAAETPADQPPPADTVPTPTVPETITDRTAVSPPPRDDPFGVGDFGDRSGPGGFGVGAKMFGAVPTDSYRAIWLPSESVTNEPGRHLGFVEQSLSASCPLYSDGDNVVTGRVGVREQSFETNALLPGSQQPFPDQLWNISIGVTGAHQFDNGWIAGLGLSGGSASNRPFESGKELNANVNSFLRIPVRETDAWNFTLAYSPLGQIAFPVPGVSYFWHPSDCFSANIGLPFSLHWRPLDDLSLDFSYMLLTTVHARATYRLTDSFYLYGGFNWINQGYHLSADGDSTNHFFYYEKNVTAGGRWIITRHVSFDITSGYAFDRYYSEGRALGRGSGQRVDIEAGPFLSGQFGVRW
jgi:hypothetical protein